MVVEAEELEEEVLVAGGGSSVLLLLLLLLLKKPREEVLAMVQGREALRVANTLEFDALEGSLKEAPKGPDHTFGKEGRVEDDAFVVVDE